MVMEHLPDVKEALQRFKGQDPIFPGDLNLEVDDAQSLWIKRVMDLLKEYGLIDLFRSFRKRQWFQDLETWTQFRHGNVFRSRCDYILGTDRRRFELVRIRDMRN